MQKYLQLAKKYDKYYHNKVPNKQKNMTVNYTNIRKQFKRQEARQKPKLSRQTAAKFNYAACMLPVIYNFIYKRPLLAILFLILTVIPHIADLFVSATIYTLIVWTVSILAIALAIYSGKTGNKDAYNARDYDDEEDFLNSQKWWIYGAIAALILHLFILPMQINGHCNTTRMMRLADAKEELKTAIAKGAESGDILGVNTFGEDIPSYFAKYVTGVFDNENTIKSKKGYTYVIEGYEQECGPRVSNTYHGKKTACAKVHIDVNGAKGPNQSASNENGDGVKDLMNNSRKLKDIFVLYVYDDDLAPKEGSIEEFAFKKFERKQHKCLTKLKKN